MNTFLTKLAMLVLFLLSVTFAWAAMTMVFDVSLFNILLGILAAFFLLRAFELADKINKLGPYSDEPEEPKQQPPFHRGPRTRSSDDDEIPDEE